MVKKSDFTEDKVAAARGVLCEVFQRLTESREQIVLIGGWVPEFIFSEPKTPYVGSMDVDLALSEQLLQQSGNNDIRTRLANYGFERDENPTIMWRLIPLHGETIRVRIDLFPLQSATIENSGAVLDKSETQLFSESSFCVSVDGEFFDGRKERVEIRVASLALFLALKGKAFSDRLKTKDAWDIYYCLRTYPDSLEALANEIKPLMQYDLIRAGFQCIAQLFSSIDDYGPKFTVDFDEISDPDERELIVRDVFERVHTLLNFLGIQ
jgi:hypothetical protein